MKYLPLYYEWMKSGSMPYSGLCRCFFGKTLFTKFIIPDAPDWGFWGYEGYVRFTDQCSKSERIDVEYTFTPLRQNIVLLLAAMAGEFDNNNHEKSRRKKK